MTPVTYSMLDVLAAIVGPGGAFPLGSGAGVAEEGITIEPASDLNVMTIGADGSGMHSLIANKGAKFTVRLLKTSPVNQQLAAMMAFQRLSGANHGQNTITLTNRVSGDVVTSQQVAFAKAPTLTYAKEGGTNEWTFDVINSDIGLGAGVA